MPNRQTYYYALNAEDGQQHCQQHQQNQKHVPFFTKIALQSIWSNQPKVTFNTRLPRGPRDPNIPFISNDTFNTIIPLQAWVTSSPNVSLRTLQNPSTNGSDKYKCSGQKSKDR